MKIRKLFVAVLMLALILGAQDAQARKNNHTSSNRSRATSLVDRSAEYADIVIDAHTGRIIHETSSEELRHPASLTKMMTLYMAFQSLEAGRLNLSQYLPVSQNAANQSPSKLGLRAGQRIRVEDVVLGLVTESANDAAVVLGEALGGSEAGFAAMMTRQAHHLGMTRTRFRNPSGLPDSEQVTTAHDMAILGAALIQHFPQFYPYFSRENFTYAGVQHRNHNRLMDRYEGMDGIKTGYIRASGFNLVASARRGNTRLVGVVFGGRSAVARDNHMARLLDESFDAALADARLPQYASAHGEGDGEGDSSDYVALPAKVAAAFSSRGALSVVPYEPTTEADTRNIVSRSAPSSKPMVPSSARSSVHGRGWGIQIGAYSDAAIGQQAVAALVSSMPGLLANASPAVQQVKAAGGVTLYRARLMSIDKKTAQNVCSYLIQRGKSCLTVEP